MNSEKKDLVTVIGRLAQNDGNYETSIPALSLFRRSNATQPTPCIYSFGLAITVQGDKQVVQRDHVFNFGAGQALMLTADLPVVSHVTHATSTEPYLGLVLLMEPTIIVQLAAEMALPPLRKEETNQPISLIELDSGINDALIRLLNLLHEPKLIPQLAPLIEREIAARLLTAADSSKIRHFASADSPSQKIIQAITWLKHHFKSPVLVDEMANTAHMSPSTFRQHFKSVVGMSPVQYQKQLRLLEARQLMLNKNLDAGSVALQVGYESTSQFSREYCRLFGAPPLRDIKRIQHDVSYRLPT